MSRTRSGLSVTTPYRQLTPSAADLVACPISDELRLLLSGATVLRELTLRIDIVEDNLASLLMRFEGALRGLKVPLRRLELEIHCGSAAELALMMRRESATKRFNTIDRELFPVSLPRFHVSIRSRRQRIALLQHELRHLFPQLHAFEQLCVSTPTTAGTSLRLSPPPGSHPL